MPFFQVDDKLIVTYGKVGSSSLYKLLSELKPYRFCTGNDAGITQGFIQDNFQDFGLDSSYRIIEPDNNWFGNRLPYPIHVDLGSINKNTEVNRITNAYNWIKHNADKKLILLMRDPVERFHSGMFQFMKTRILNSLFYKGTYKADDSSTLQVILEGREGFPKGRNYQDFENTMSKAETEQHLDNLLNPEWWCQTLTVMLAVALPNIHDARQEQITGNLNNNLLINMIDKDLSHAGEGYHMGNYLINATQKLHKHIDVAVDLTDLSDWLISEQLPGIHENQSDLPSWGFLVNNPNNPVEYSMQINQDIKQAYRTGMLNTEIWQLFEQYLKPEINTYKTIHRGKHIRVETVYHTENKET